MCCFPKLLIRKIGKPWNLGWVESISKDPPINQRCQPVSLVVVRDHIGFDHRPHLQVGVLHLGSGVFSTKNDGFGSFFPKDLQSQPAWSSPNSTRPRLCPFRHRRVFNWKSSSSFFGEKSSCKNISNNKTHTLQVFVKPPCIFNTSFRQQISKTKTYGK